MRTLLLLAALGLSACSRPPAKGPYDASRDAGVDIQSAVARAKAEKKRVLVEAGGNWCPWCHTMHAFYDANPKLAALRDAKFVTVLVAVEPGKPLPRAIASWPAPAGFPHLYVLDENGVVLQSQDTSALEKGESYDLEKFEFFLKDFGTKRR
jgi:hypothetical protein